MERRKIRVGIIGVGQIGKHHVQAYANMPDDVEVAALCDIDEAELARVATKHGVDVTYARFRDLLKRDDVEAGEERCEVDLTGQVNAELRRLRASPELLAAQAELAPPPPTTNAPPATAP